MAPQPNDRSRGCGFVGKTADVNPHVYELSPTAGQRNQFARTTLEIAEYCARTIHSAAAYRQGITHLKDLDASRPSEPDDPTDLVKLHIWKNDYDAWTARKKQRERCQGQIFAIILGRCSMPLRERMQGWEEEWERMQGWEEEWKRLATSKDVIALLKMIRKAMRGGGSAARAVAATKARDACLSLQRSDRRRCKPLLDNLTNEYILNMLRGYQGAHIIGDQQTTQESLGLVQLGTPLADGMGC